MMLPEHKEAIRLSNERDHQKEKHKLDPDELDHIGLVLMDALNHTHSVAINYLHDWNYHDVIYYIVSVDKDQKQIKVELDNGETDYIQVDCLRNVAIL